MIYFDSAATTMQKPESVVDAVTSAMGTMASVGRGNSSASQTASELMLCCREEAGELFGVSDPERVIFTFNATHALNIAIHSLVKSGQKILISGYEHNAVTRPLASIPNLEIKVIDTPLFRNDLFLSVLEKQLKMGADVMVCTHVSNVFGYILPIKEVAKLCKKWGCALIVDASQSAGVVPLEIEKWQADFVAMPGHKGLYGPQGTGMLLCQAEPLPFMFGGTGSQSIEQKMPTFLPDKLEAGTHNVAGIAGLLEGIRFVKKNGEKKIARHENRLKYLLAELLDDSKIHCFYHSEDLLQVGVLSFYVDGYDCGEIADFLSMKGVAVRSGLHCAPIAHKTVGTQEKGTVRVSFSYFNREEEVVNFVQLLKSYLYMEKRES